MIDNLTFALTHGLLALALWRLLGRDDLDADPVVDADAPAPPVGRAGSAGGRLRRAAGLRPGRGR